jgi:hypothetical protein
MIIYGIQQILKQRKIMSDKLKSKKQTGSNNPSISSYNPSIFFFFLFEVEAIAVGTLIDDEEEEEEEKDKESNGNSQTFINPSQLPLNNLKKKKKKK